MGLLGNRIVRPLHHVHPVNLFSPRFAPLGRPPTHPMLCACVGGDGSLLYDYEEAPRSEILDLLFKPK